MEVHLEKKSIYDPVVEDMKSKYKLNFNIEVIGILVGARGSISNYTRNLLKNINLPTSVFMDMATSAVKGSCRTIQFHLYSHHNNNN